MQISLSVRQMVILGVFFVVLGGATVWALYSITSIISPREPEREELVISKNTTLLVWLDVYIPPTPDGLFYLSGKYISPVTDLGAKIANIVFSPDRQLLWYLVEARAEVLPSLANLSMVQNWSLAKVGVWEYWDVAWRETTKIDPILRVMADRVGDDKLQVIIYYGEQNESRPEIESNITTLVESIGGKIVRIDFELMLVEVPANTLDLIAENKYVTTLEADRPLVLRGFSQTRFASRTQSLEISS